MNKLQELEKRFSLAGDEFWEGIKNTFEYVQNDLLDVKDGNLTEERFLQRLARS